ncbi:MAG: hypothetical protein KA444_04235 [Bacteroidia bacterium]|nr:hypothetical protein [Bacteroidia bacterium]
MKKTLLILLLAITASFSKTSAQDPAIITSDKTGWQKIADKNVDLKVDRDEISILGADRFAAIKIRVTEASLEIYDMEIHYESGDKEVIEVRSPMKAGSESKAFDLKGTERELKQIVLIYKTVPNQKDEKAHLEIWGLKTNANAGTSAIPSVGIVVSDKTGWHKIGERSVEFKSDRDEILVLGADRFSAIKFAITGASVDMLDLEVYYDSGDKQEIQVRTPITAGKESRVIDLNGGERILKKIVFVYKTLPNQQETKAHVELWGLKTNQPKTKL